MSSSSSDNPSGPSEDLDSGDDVGTDSGASSDEDLHIEMNNLWLIRSAKSKVYHGTNVEKAKGKVKEAAKSAKHRISNTPKAHHKQRIQGHGHIRQRDIGLSTTWVRIWAQAASSKARAAG